MSLLEHIFDLLLANGNITELIGGNIFPANLPENPPFPFLEMTTDDGEVWQSSDGHAGVAVNVVQFDCLSKTKGDTYDVIGQILDMFCKEMLTDDVIQEVTIDSGPFDLDKSLADGTGNKVFRRAIRLQFIYNLNNGA